MTAANAGSRNTYIPTFAEFLYLPVLKKRKYFPHTVSPGLVVLSIFYFK